MNFKRVIFFLSSSFFLNFVFAQNLKAIDCYKNLQYKKAVQSLLKNHTTIADELLLADALVKIKDISNAELYISKASNYYPKSTKDFDQILEKYMEILVIAGKHSEAKAIYASNEKLLAKNSLAVALHNTISNRETWSNAPKKHEVIQINHINSQFNEFSLVKSNMNYYYVTSKNKDYIGYGGIDKVMEQPYTRLHIASMKSINNFSDRGFAFPMYNNAYNQGPLTINASGDIAYYSMAVADNTSKKSTYHNKIFQSNFVNGKWQDATPLEFNIDGYNFLHPFLNSTGTQLYFSSNMIGGFGNYDLYVCNKYGNTWSSPKNLGKVINTERDEIFPFVDVDNKTIYFSSNGHAALGGFDIFYSKSKGDLWNVIPVNLYEPINSTSDDFAFFKLDSTGYFASDRPGGLGGDDIYGFTVNNNLEDAQYLLAFDKDFSQLLKNAKAQLYDHDKLVATSYISMNGSASFYNVDKNKNYDLLIQPDRSEINEASKIYLANEAKQPVKLAARNDDDFLFSNVPSNLNNLKNLDDASEAGEMSFKAIVVAGNDFYKPIKNLKLSLLDNGNVVYQTRITDNNGQFAFNRLNTENTLFCKVDEDLLKYLNLSEISVYALDSTLLASIRVNSFGKFEFQLLPADKKLLSIMTIEDIPYAIDISGILKKGNGNNEILKGVDVLLLNEKGEILQRTMSDNNGRFKFSKLLPDQNFMITTDADDPIWKNIEAVSINDAKDKVIYIQGMKKGNTFNFPILTNDQRRLSLMDEEEASYEYAIKGKLLGDGKSPIKNANVGLKESGTLVMYGNQNTDSNGFFSFGNLAMGKKFDLYLDKKDKVFESFSELVIVDINGKEIYRARKENFIFSFLMSDNKVLSMIEVKDETEFQPKTFSFQILSNEGKPLANRKVQLINARQKNVFDGTTDENGNIFLKDINLKENYNLVMLTDKEKFESALALADSKGNVIKKGYLSKDGTYKFTVLKQDILEMSQLPTEDAAFKMLNQNMNWNNIYFDYGKFQITQKSAIELDKLVAAMRLDSKIKAEIEAHTDVVSGAAFNLVLSKKRLAAVMYYIYNKGINKKRLVGKYFGESKPLQKKASEAEYSEQDNGLNRRAEFKLFVK